MKNLETVLYEPLIGQSIKDLEVFSISLGEPPFRGRQLFDWVYRKRVYDFGLMTDLPKSFIDLIKNIPIHPLKILNSKKSSSKSTKKYLFITQSGKMVESVLMVEKNRTTICLSTQVGCAVDCDFCATAKMGFIQNLSAGEIIDQYIQLEKISETKITNVVFMGMGEPFLNYKNSITAAKLLNHSKGINFGAWRITISTVGIITKIKQFTNEKQPFKLAVSLNGTNHQQRLTIMPITKKQTFSDLLNVIKYYTDQTRKRVTIEYVLLAGINDHPIDAKKLKEILSPIKCKLNLIPYNEINGSYKRPITNNINSFVKYFNNVSFPVTVRWSKGQDIDAGCGQLATEAV